MSEKKAFIIYERFYDFSKKNVLAGGVQTYISNLIPILSEAKYKTFVYQFSKDNKSEVAEVNNCKVISVPGSFVNGVYKTEVVLQYIKNEFDADKDLLIFADHILAEKNFAKNSISIQHGIHWDIIKDSSRSNLRMFAAKAKFAYNEHKRMKYVKQVVCVDYNFLNWYRAQVDVPNSNLSVIPNFTVISELNDKSDDIIKIIFARRFVKHRGTRVFANAIDQILDEYDNIHITVAGRGPDEGYLHNKLDKWGSKVDFITYQSDESLKIHSDKHIAIVPTIGSEGTSLSLLEAMSSQCAVVCTDVGGMTNIVLNDYNGKIVSSGDIQQLKDAIKEYIEFPDERKRIAKAGYETVKYAFSFEKWSKRWKNIINQFD